MKIKLKETPEQVEMIRAMGSKDPATSRPAQEAFAAFLGPVIQKVLSQAGTASMIYKDVGYDEDSDPSFPLDLYYGQGVDSVKVWYQSMAGGLGSSHVSGMSELKFTPYRLDSAVDFLKKYARKARLDVVSLVLNRMSQEILIKQERNAWIILMRALAEASTNSLSHVIAATTASVFQVDDLNRLMTRNRRLSASFAGGTSDDSFGVTDLIVSPEIKEQIRSFAYQPMNTRGVPNSDESTALGLPDKVREDIYRSAGASEIYGVGITELLELGTGQKYNTLFKSFYTGSFVAASDEVAVALDLGRDAMLRPVARNADTGSQFTTTPDDSYVQRQDRAGFFGSLEESRICIDARCLSAITI